MPIINRIADFHADMIGWRHDLHAHPETAFEERRTADIVARLLESFGIRRRLQVVNAAGIAGALQAKLARRITAEHVAGQDAVADQILFAGRDAFGIERRGAESAPPSTWLKPATLAARSISSFSRPRRTRAGPG